MKRDKNQIRLVLTMLVCVMVISTGVWARGINYTSAFNILIINSYQIGHHWEEYVMEGFKQAANEYGESNINIKIEYFDFRNRNDAEYVTSFLELIEKKYPHGSVDAIYTIDDEAFSVISPEITNSNSELYHVPLFFSGVDANITFTQEEEQYITGIYQRDVTLECFNLILQIDDTIDQINIITESSGFGDNLIEKATNIIEEHLENEIVLNVIQSDYIEDVVFQLQALQTATKDTKTNEIILLGGEFQDKDTGVFLDPKESVEIMKKYSPWPIYSNDPTYLTAGILGGCMDIGQLQGEEIFNTMKRVIEGETIAAIESKFAPSPKWLLKYNAIYEYNIDLNNIPRKCTIIDKKPYQFLLPRYMKSIFCVIGSFILLFIFFLIAYLIYAFKEIRRQKREAQLGIERENMQTDFLVNISHELRTPINIILSAVSVMKLQLDETGKKWSKKQLEEKLHTITQNAYRLLKLSNNIIDISKIESGKLTVNMQNYNIVDIVEDIFSETIDYASKKDIKMIFDTHEEEIMITVDRELIQRIVLNLLSNAIKFTPLGGTICATVKKEKKYVVIEVEDTGMGIPKERLETIFHRFYQVDNSLTRVNEGSGIGLCIVKELVALHDGKIEVTSELGKGTSIQVFLPDRYDATQKDMSCQTCLNTTVNTEMSDVVK